MPINAVNLTGNVYPAGPKGDTGPANTLEIGTVEKGENASASITGEAPNQTLNLILPKGDKGEKGDTGETNSLSIGTVEKGTVPSATITGQAPNQILNLVLPKGDTGEKGEVGPRGEQGIQGNPGPINSIKIGRVEKGEEASVTIVGESPNQILNFVLPIGPKGNTGEKGDQGPKGEQGIQGETGATTSLSIGLVSSGEEASATIIGEAPDQILNLVLPKGDKGEKGNVGPQGVQGIQGETGPANSLTIGTVEKGAVPSATITGEAPNQVLNLVLPTGETAEIEAIQEEQTTQNENIEKNAEGIAQNKKDVDEELTKIKKENSLLKSQIPTGTASGNNIHLEDSSNMDFEWKLRGESYQEVKPYNNLVKNADFKNDLNEWKASSKFSVVNKNGIKYLKISTSTKGFNRAYQGLNTIAEHKYYVAMKCIKDKAWVSAELFLSASLSDNYPQPAKSITSNIYQNETSVSTILVPKSSNCSIGVMFQYSNTDEVWEAYLRDFICIDLTELYGEGNEPDQTTCDNLFTFDKVAYGTSPSAYTLSQIENVGNNINLYDKNNPNILNTPIDSNGTGVNVQDTYKTIWIPCKPNTTYTVSKIFDETKNRFGVGYSSIEPNYSQAVEGYISNEKANVLTVTTNATAKYLLAYVWIKGGSTTYGEILDSIKIEEGEATSYSNYNCGSFGVTISNRDLFNPEWLVIGNLSSDYGQEFIQNNYARTKHIPVEPNENLSITMFDTTNFRASALYFYDKDKNLIKRTVAPSNVGWDNFSTMGNCKYIRFTIAVVGSKYPTFTEEALQEASNNLQLERGVSTSYIPHEEQEIVFPLTEGQRLYAGSYLAEDGIHNKRKQVVLTGNENWERDNTFDTTKTILFKVNNNIVNNTNVNDVTFKSNYFIHKRWIDSIYKKLDEPYISQTEITNLYININKDVLSRLDVEGLKAWLSEHNVIVEYPLAEEEIISYTPKQQAVIDKILYTYKNVTNISVDDELATLEISYKKDIETMFNNQAKEYNERLSNIESLLNTTSTSALLLDNLENDLKEEV